MAASYKILKTSVGLYPCIVFATSFVNPMDQKEAIADDLKRIGMKGKILFDLLLSHGNTPDRFFEVFFDGEEIDEESLRSIETITDRIKEIASEFYQSQEQLVDNSVLTKAQKFLIKKKAYL